MSHNKFENGVSYFDITRKIEAFIDHHFTLDSKQEQEDNLCEMLMYTMEYPEYINYYDCMREAILENIQNNYLCVSEDEALIEVCNDWVDLFDA